MSKHLSLHATALASVLLLGACNTTGDPRAGGLFGWSEEKAQFRNEQLQRDNDLAKRQLQEEQQRQAALRNQQQGLNAEAGQLQRDLDGLMAENQRLDASLRDLMKKRQLGTAETQRLSRLLAENERLRKAARQPIPPAARTGAATAAQPSPRVDAVSQQNEALHREVMILLQ